MHWRLLIMSLLVGGIVKALLSIITFVLTCVMFSSTQLAASELSPELTELEIAKMEHAMATKDMSYIERKISEIKLELLEVEQDLSILESANVWNHVTDTLLILAGLVIAFLMLALTVIGFKLLAVASTALIGVTILVGLVLTAVIGWDKPLLGDSMYTSRQQIKATQHKINKKKTEAFELREELESLQAEFCQSEDYVMLPECSSR